MIPLIEFVARSSGKWWWLTIPPERGSTEPTVAVVPGHDVQEAAMLAVELDLARNDAGVTGVPLDEKPPARYWGRTIDASEAADLQARGWGSTDDADVLVDEPDPQFDEVRFQAWYEQQVTTPMRDSLFVATILTGAIDWKIALEVGAAVLMDKPIVVLTHPGVDLPPKLALLATSHLQYHVDEDGKPEFARTSQELAELVERLTRNEGRQP